MENGRGCPRFVKDVCCFNTKKCFNEIRIVFKNTYNYVKDKLDFPTFKSVFSNNRFHQDNTWFAMDNKKTPLQNFSFHWDQFYNKGIRLHTDGRYSEIYAASAGNMLWNNLEEKQIYGYDKKTDSYIPLSIELWSSYYFDH